MVTRLSSGFELSPFSDLEREGMAVEIRFHGEPVAEIDKDKGLDGCEIEVPSRFSPDGKQFKFPLADFLEALEEGRRLLSTL